MKMDQLSLFVELSKDVGESTRQALWLLRTVPAAREACLESFFNIYDEAIREYMTKWDSSAMHPGNGSEKDNCDESPLLSIIDEVETMLISFVTANSSVWAPRISKWVIKLLGKVSSRYGGRRRFAGASTLNEILLVWISCKPSNSLIRIASHCFVSMPSNMTGDTVEELLNASVQFTPHFDWVVAHIGSCYPGMILSRVMACGLKDFYDAEMIKELGGSSAGSDSSAQVSKLPSVVGILSHLGSQHLPELHNSIRQIFLEGLSDKSSQMELMTPMYLLHLCSVSTVLQRAVVHEFLHTVNLDVLCRLVLLYQSKRQPIRDQNSMLNSTVHVLMKNSEQSSELCKRLIGWATLLDDESTVNVKYNREHLRVVSLYTNKILNQLLVSLQRAAHARSLDSPMEISLLNSLKSASADLINKLVLLHDNQSKQNLFEIRWLSKLLCCIAINGGSDCAAEILSNLLYSIDKTNQLSIFCTILQEVQLRHTDVLSKTLYKIFSTPGGTRLVNNKSQDIKEERMDTDQQKTAESCRPSDGMSRVLTNLSSLIRYQTAPESSNKVIGSSLLIALEYYMDSVSALLISARDERTAVAALQLLELLDSLRPGSSRRDASKQLRLISRVVQYFFSTFKHGQTTEDAVVKKEMCRKCLVYLIHLAQSKTCVQTMILRCLLEAAFSEENVASFGCQPIHTRSLVVHYNYGGVEALTNPSSSLSEENQNITNQSRQNFSHGEFNPKPSRYSHVEINVDKISITSNRQMFVSTLWSICHLASRNDQNIRVTSGADPQVKGQINGNSRSALDCLRCLSAMLEELISPDAMAAGSEWPEPDFIKITIERDLMIRRSFDDCPLIWDIIELLAGAPAAVRHLSTLLRSVLATLIGQWEMLRDRPSTNKNDLVITTRRLLNVLHKSEILVEPLCYTDDLLEFVSVHDVHLLLLNIWRYLKEFFSQPSHRMNPGLLVPAAGHFPFSEGLLIKSKNARIWYNRPTIKTLSLAGKFTQPLYDVLQSNISQLGHLFPLFFPSPQ